MGLIINPKPKLIAALGNAQEYLHLAISAQHRGEREFYGSTNVSQSCISRSPRSLRP
jgi:hypothetical protein